MRVCATGVCRQGRVEISERDIDEVCTSTCPLKNKCPLSMAVVSSTTAGSKSQAGDTSLHAVPTASVIASFPVMRLTHTINTILLSLIITKLE